MSKLLVSALVARAISDIDRKAQEVNMPENLKRIQDAFSNSPALQNQEGLAELCGLITGFKPRTQRNVVQPFEVFVVLSKAEQRIVKTVLCLYASGGNSYGCSSLNDNNTAYTAETCRLATADEAKAFISQEVATWEDSALLVWVNTKLGANYLQPFMMELDRQMPSVANVAVKAAK